MFTRGNLGEAVLSFFILEARQVGLQCLNTIIFYRLSFRHPTLNVIIVLYQLPTLQCGAAKKNKK